MNSMYEGRDLKKEVDELGIIAMEDFGFGSRESTFAAIDAIREHNKNFPEQRLAQMMDDAKQEAYNNMAGTTKDRKGEN